MNVLQILLPKNYLTFIKDVTNADRAMEILRESGYTAIPVVRDDGTYAGIVSEGDFLWAIHDEKIHDEKGYPVRLHQILKTGRNQAVRIDAEIEELISRTLEQNFVPVVDDRNMFIGIVTRKSVIRYLMDEMEAIKRASRESEKGPEQGTKQGEKQGMQNEPGASADGQDPAEDSREHLKKQAEELVAKTRLGMKEQPVDMVYRLQLRDDCEAIERLLKKMEKGNEKKAKKLELELESAIVRLTTTSGRILWDK